ncbi:MAG: hypothetical protein ABIY35_08425 [Chitinophagaceae bacterium]
MKKAREPLFTCVLAISIILYFLLGYYATREKFDITGGLFAILFMGYFLLLRKNNISEKYLLYAGIIFRVIFLFSIPALSPDFYRFIWDGQVFLHGYNPYLHTPQELMAQTGFRITNADILLSKMGSLSAGNHTNYPPVCQGIFALGVYIAGNSILGTVITFRMIILFCDIGIYYFGKKILSLLNLQVKNIFLYFLNPLVIAELTGNLHFEGIMIFFLFIAIYFLLNKKIMPAALFFAISISVKLVPLMLLPLLWRWLGLKKAIVFYVITGITIILLFLPFFSIEFFNNYYNTISLWFVNFEFNASVYYVIREIGFYIKGYDIIHAVGKIMPIIIILYILFFSFSKKNIHTNKLFENVLIVLSVYFFLSTTVHPWYIVTLVALSIFTRYRFAILWSAMVILSYYAYSQNPFRESYMLLFIEYGAVFVLFFREISRKKNIDEGQKLFS